MFFVNSYSFIFYLYLKNGQYYLNLKDCMINTTSNFFIQKVLSKVAAFSDFIAIGCGDMQFCHSDRRNILSWKYFCNKKISTKISLLCRIETLPPYFRDVLKLNSYLTPNQASSKNQTKLTDWVRMMSSRLIGKKNRVFFC